MKKVILTLALLVIFLPLAMAVTNKAYVPPAGKKLLIIGQDLTSVYNYVQAGGLPTPGGVTTYLSFYDLLSTNFPQYGALGEDASGTATTVDVDWGGGPLHAHNSSAGYVTSTLSIGLNMYEAYAPNGLSKIAAGDYDAQIKRLAKFIKDANKPVYLRIGYEFDGNWNTGYSNSTNYKAAYKKIVDVIRAEGTTNVAFVWQACASPLDDLVDGYTENINDWYPGSSYVDWCGLSWFLLPNETHSGSYTQKQLADEVLAFARLNSKPVMICESTPQGYSIGGLDKRSIATIWDGAAGQNAVAKTGQQIWDEWFAPFFSYINTNSDVIQAVSYINANWNSQGSWGSPYSQGYWGDGRVEANATVKANWITEMNKPEWLHGSPSLFGVLDNTIPPLTDLPIPGKIEAEKYSDMSGIQLAGAGEDATTTVAWYGLNDWIEYSVDVAQAGIYTVEFRIATINANCQMQLKSGATVLGTINIPTATADWNTYATHSMTVTLAAGKQTLRLTNTAAGDLSLNVNWINFKSQATTLVSTLSNQKLDIFPNPSNGTFNLVLDNSLNQEQVEIRIMDISGKTVLTTTKNGDNIKIDTDLPKGIYIIDVTTTRLKVQKKLIIK